MSTPGIVDTKVHRAGTREWLTLGVLMLPVLLVSIDNTVLSFALPAISEAIKPSATQQLWLADAYSLILAGFLVTMGSLADRFGRRKLLLIGASGFALTSIVAALSQNAGTLIAARALMGLFGAAIMPATLSLIRSTFTDRDQRRLAVAVWATMFTAGAGLGPFVSGLLLQHYSWHSVFLVSVPVLIPLLIAAPFLLRESRDPNPGPFDPASIALSVVGLASLMYAIKEVSAGGDLRVLAPIAGVGAASLWLFVRRQRRLPVPILDMGLFTLPRFTGSIVVNLVSLMSMVGFAFFGTQYLQLVLELSALESALLLLPGGIVCVLAGLLVVPIAKRQPPHRVVPAAFAFSAIGYVVAATLHLGQGAMPLMFAFCFLAVGIGAGETVSNDLILDSVPAAKAGAASAMSETAYEVGAVLGTTILGGLITWHYRNALNLPDFLTPAQSNAASQTLAGAHDVAQSLSSARGAELMESASEAFTSGITITASVGAALTAASALFAWWAYRRTSLRSS